ncbi:phosphate ABC transporter membrane protein 2 (PhoT family) [Streptomyces sp. 1114.5]|uniref:phosphate ABC transporter permease PstA n=1 Tax=unclassified Streptomyces TaxID=2593676 RepID=UPI000BD447F3|nr:MULTISPECIES: phosphate ABC transporter permease PstA [unclassified Streptomyces]RKT16492.1 phosphate ABC transporter membrane protein 2 (PhoT family) [Streptomyces sp. 1114.5]SOB82662.1 phosphate ABC transporter membrane protein 2, PhoT family [Streptomyces sp. 1331.2]
MTTAVVEDARPLGRPLTANRLPKWAPAAVAAGSIALGCGIGAVAGLASHLQWGLISAALFLLISYGLSARVEGRRQAKDRFATSVVWVAFILAVVPLVALTVYTVQQGIAVVDGNFLSHSMKGVLQSGPGGGIYHALIGTLEQVALATAIAAPIGLLTAVYLVEYGRGKLAKTVTFFVDVMTGIPSIVAGLFVLSVWNLALGFGYSGFSGSLALAILMMPVVVRSTEEMLKLVPNELREASYALGVPKWKTILRIVLPTAIGGITTGVMLAVARITGETAPVMMLVFGADYINNNPFEGPQQSLPMYIWTQYSQVNNDFGYARAWGAALVLIAFVMGLNLIARGIARWRSPKGGR